jgi:hypothetical protein
MIARALPALSTSVWTRSRVPNRTAPKVNVFAVLYAGPAKAGHYTRHRPRRRVTPNRNIAAKKIRSSCGSDRRGTQRLASLDGPPTFTVISVLVDSAPSLAAARRT